MQATHRSRRFGRLLAVWLLLWFVVMSVPPTRPLLAVVGAGPLGSVSGDARDVADCDPAGGDHDHADKQTVQAPDGLAAFSDDVHEGHEAGALAHCPLCLHVAAPPLAELAAFAAAGTLPERPVHATPSLRRVHMNVPPPARGPPARS